MAACEGVGPPNGRAQKVLIFSAQLPITLKMDGEGRSDTKCIYFVPYRTAPPPQAVKSDKVTEQLRDM